MSDDEIEGWLGRLFRAVDDRLGWVFCEAAYRLFEAIPERAWPEGAERPSGPGWRACNWLACLFHDIGTWFYRRGS